MAAKLCNPCATGKHDRCKGTVYHELDKQQVPCTCPLRTVAGHP